MAKKAISEKLFTTHTFKVEGTFDFDKLKDGELMVEMEDEPNPVDLKGFLKKFNGDFGQLQITNKIEETPEEPREK